MGEQQQQKKIWRIFEEFVWRMINVAFLAKIHILNMLKITLHIVYEDMYVQ